MPPGIRLANPTSLTEHLDFQEAPQDAVLHCADAVTVSANCLLLATVSPLVRQLLESREVLLLEEQAHISCPGLQADHLNTFLADIYSRGKDITVHRDLKQLLFIDLNLPSPVQGNIKVFKHEVLAAPGVQPPKEEVKVKEEAEEAMVEEDSDQELRPWEGTDEPWEDEDNSDDEDYATPKKPKENKIECDDCGKFFGESYMYKHQRRMHSDRPLKYKCNICGKQYIEKNRYHIHLQSHEETKTRDVICDICDKGFLNYETLYSHKYRFHADDDKTYDCAKCDEHFKSKEDYIKHKNEFHKPFPCTHCECKYGSAFALKKHHKEKHSDICKKGVPIKVEGNGVEDTVPIQRCNIEELSEKRDKTKPKLTCEVCGKLWNTKHDLKSHMMKHSSEKNYTCLECGKQFKREESLKHHVLRHKGIKNHHCEECGEGFVSTASMTTHKRNAHPEYGVYICQECNKDCKNKYSLKRHMMGHTGERPFECTWEGCDKRFALAQIRDVHERLHKGIKEFHCTLCPKQFMQSQHLSVHMKRHNGIKDHTCITCGKAFVEPAGARNCRHGGKP